jgi:NitT/TauT family transport system substrate-binding protein
MENQRATCTRIAGAKTRITAFAALALACALAAAPVPARGDAVTLRLDWLKRSYHSPFFLGVEKGWYKEAGIDLTITEGRGSGSVVQLVGNKSETFGFATADAVVRGVHAGIPVVSVANIMPQMSDAIFVLKTSGIARPHDLKGRTLATTAGGASDVLLPAFLKGAGLTVNDVTIVPVDASVKVQTLLQGKVDAMNAPVWSMGGFYSAGGANAFRYADFGVRVVGYGIVTNSETAKSDTSLVKRFVAATMQAWNYALKNPEEALDALERASPENAKPGARARNRLDLAEAFKQVRPAVAGKPFGTQSDSDWEAMQKQLIEYKVIKEARPVRQYLTNDFIQ